MRTESISESGHGDGNSEEKSESLAQDAGMESFNLDPFSNKELETEELPIELPWKLVTPTTASDPELDAAASEMALMVDMTAPPSLENSLSIELHEKSIDTTIFYDPEIPHTDEEIIFVRHCVNSIIDIYLCYQCFGERRENTPVLLLVCGLNMQLFAWDEAFCEGLARAGFYVIRYDNRDSGKSTKVPRGDVKGYRLLLPASIATALGERMPYTIEDMAKDGLALLEALHIPHAHVLGISMGGMIAQTMAILDSERVVSLTSIMSSTNAKDLPHAQLKVKLWMLRKPPPNCSLDTLLDFRINSLRKMLPHTLSVDSKYLKKRYLISLQRSNYSEGLIRQAGAILRCPPRDEALKRLTIPALIVHGTQDLLVPPLHGLRTATVIPRARLLVLKHMGHYFHPAFYQPIIMGFTAMTAHTAFPSLQSPGSLVFPSFIQEDSRPPTDVPPSISPDLPEPSDPAPIREASPGSELPENPACVLSSPSSPTLSIGKPVIQTLRHSALQIVVVERQSPCGDAVYASMAVAVPITHSPNTPEAVLIDLSEAYTAHRQANASLAAGSAVSDGENGAPKQASHSDPLADQSASRAPDTIAKPSTPPPRLVEAPHTLSSRASVPLSSSPAARNATGRKKPRKNHPTLMLSKEDGVVPFIVDDASPWNFPFSPPHESPNEGDKNAFSYGLNTFSVLKPNSLASLAAAPNKFYSRISDYMKWKRE